MTARETPRRWFRFSLRTLFVVLTILGVWLGVQVKWIKDRHAAKLLLKGGERSCALEHFDPR